MTQVLISQCLNSNDDYKSSARLEDLLVIPPELKLDPDLQSHFSHL